MASPSGSGSRFAALALSPRAAVVLAAAVVVAALVVVLLGSRSGTGTGAGGATVSVSGGPSAAVATPSGPSSPPTGVVVVHVVGAVRRAGVVSLGAGSRVSVAIDRAGGATPEADLARLNLARVVVDGERLYVPKAGETEVPAALDDAGAVSGAGGSGGGADAEEVVDLNSADQAALETLPGIGPSLAGRILAWRDEHGRFGSVEDLLDVSGIGDGRFADLRDRVRV